MRDFRLQRRKGRVARAQQISNLRRRSGTDSGAYLQLNPMTQAVAGTAEDHREDMHMYKGLAMAAAFSAALLIGAQAQAQGGPLPYGTPITLDQAKKIAAAAEAEAKKNGWNEVIVIVEPNGAMVYMEKMDDTQYGSVKVAT
jgi:Haem degrading protein HbpS-like